MAVHLFLFQNKRHYQTFIKLIMETTDFYVLKLQFKAEDVETGEMKKQKPPIRMLWQSFMHRLPPVQTLHGPNRR